MSDGRQKMHLARLAWEGEAKQLAVKQSPLPQFNVGCSGWFYWHWRGGFYPAALPTNQWFEHYAKHFKTVELNAPFYSWPTHRGGAGVGPTNRTSEIRLHGQSFGTDYAREDGSVGQRRWCATSGTSPICLALEWDAFSFNFRRAFITHARGSIAFSLSSIHHGGMSSSFGIRSWWRESVFAAFRAAGVIFCSCSGPRLPDELVKTADESISVFTARSGGIGTTTPARSSTEWVSKIRAASPARVWAYFNNDRDGHAIKNARSLLRLLQA